MYSQNIYKWGILAKVMQRIQMKVGELDWDFKQPATWNTAD